MIRRPVVLVLVLALLGAAGCSGDGRSSGPGGTGGSASTEPPRTTSEVLAKVADETIVPAYTSLGERIEALSEVVESLCRSADPADLGAARDAWRSAVEAWQASRAGGVGPAMDRRLMADVAFATRPGPVASLLAGDEPLDPDSMRSRGALFRGLYLVEALVFGEEADLLGTPAGDRRCQLLASTIPIASEAVDAVRADWAEGDPPHAVTFAEGPGGDPLSSVDALTNQVIASLTALDDQGLRDLALADALHDVADARRDGPAGMRMAELRALLAGVARVLDGDQATADDGLVDVVAARSSDTATRLRALARTAVDALAVLPDSAASAFTEAHDDLVAAADAVAALKVLVSTEVASQLGITVRFSDADGDS